MKFGIDDAPSKKIPKILGVKTGKNHNRKGGCHLENNLLFSTSISLQFALVPIE
jgi:hypothetical protein